MSTQVQFRRGTTAQHSSFTGAVGECTVDTDKDTLVIHDGATAGGFPLERAPSSSTDNGVPRFDGTTGAILQTSAATISDAGLLTTTTLALTANSNQVVLDSDGTYTTTLTASASTSSKTITFPNTTGTVALTADKLSAFSATTSAELAGVISDETGSGALVFATSPTLVTPTLGVATGTSLNLTANSNQIVLDSDDGSGFTTTITDSATAARVLTLPDLTTTLVGSDASSVTDGGLVVWDGTTGKKVKAVATTSLDAVANNFLVGNSTPAWDVFTPAEARDALGFQTTGESTDDALVKFDGTAGATQNSTATLTDAGLLTTASLALTANSNQLVLDSDGTYTTTLTAAASGSSKTITLPNTTGTVALTGDKLSAFAATTSAELAGVISDETGSGLLVFATSPTLTTPNIGVATGTTLSLTADSNQIVLDSDATYTTTLTATASTSSKTITLPNATGTVVLKDTTDTLENKTLTTPKFVNSGYIADSNGNELMVFGVTASAVNHIKFSNSSTGNNPKFEAVGDDTDIDLNLIAKGAGKVTAGGIEVVTRTASQTLTNKTLTAPRVADGGFIADANGNEQIKFVTTASAVNELTVTNAATGNGVTIAATGGDTDIDLRLSGKGTGAVLLNGATPMTFGGNQFDAALSEKTSLTANDRFLIEDSADSDNKKYVVWSNVLPTSSDTVSGKVELATASETTTGTDTGRAVTPDGLAGSDYGKRVVGIQVVDAATDCATGDGKAFFRIPAIMNGWNLVAVAMSCYTAGTTGTMDVQIRNKTDSQDMLSTKLTIDSTETDTSTAATAAVINTSYDDVATGDCIAIDVDAVQTTKAKGLYVEMTFQLP